MMQAEPLHQLSSSPSFSSYSSDNFAHIAARVIHEIRNDTLYESTEENDNLTPPQPNDDVVDDFEFSFVSRHPDSPVSADDIFYNGQIRPIYPLLDRRLLNNAETAPVEDRPRRLPLRELMFEERETVNDTNDLEGVDAGTYCVWNPPCKDKKSSSTGSLLSSKRWKLRDLLIRSHSYGTKKESLLFRGPAKRTNKVAPKHSSANNGGSAAR